MKKTGFKILSYEEKINKLNNKKIINSNKPLKRKRTLTLQASKSTSSVLKKEIQALLRAIVILRDGGCFLRNYEDSITPQYSMCGGIRKDGELILQAEHLHTRSSARSFSDDRLVVCVCQRHHIYYKPQHSNEYNKLAKKYIGKSNAKLWDMVAEDRTAFKVDLKLEKLALEKTLKKLLKDNYDKKDNSNVIKEIYKNYYR